MVLKSKCSFITINKRRSDRQSSVTRTGETKARQNHQQGNAMVGAGGKQRGYHKAGRVKKAGSKWSES